jgi:hypothetical protein
MPPTTWKLEGMETRLSNKRMFVRARIVALPEIDPL